MTTRTETVVSPSALERPCRECNGKGDRSKSWDRCGACRGSGRELTEFGEAVLDLVQRNVRRMFRAELAD
jgi:DnaJ-class molecular chaperone